MSLPLASPLLGTPGVTGRTSLDGAPTPSTSKFELSRLRCRVHPAVIMTMLDAHGRLRDTHGFAIGTLLGSVTNETSSRSGAVVEVLDCYINPYHWDKATNALTIQKDQHEWMFKLREKINSKLCVVGWCCTTSTVFYTAALSDWARAESKVSKFIATKALPEPIHLLIDPHFKNQQSILKESKCYVRGPLRQLFHEIPLDLSLNEADKIGIGSILRHQRHKIHHSPPEETSSSSSGSFGSSFSPDFGQGDLFSCLINFKELLNKPTQYVESVLAGEVEGDPDVGRALMRALSVDSLLPQHEADLVSEGAIQDNLMIAYLTNLACLQFTAAEKLNASFL